MRRALTATELNTFRTRPQRSRWYLAVHRPASIFSSKILATPDTYPASAIQLDGAFDVGDKSLATKNMTVLIGSLPGASDEGRIRLRKGFAGNVMPIAESGCAVNRYTAGLFATVIDEFAPVPIMPKYNRSASQWRMDWGEPYTDELENYGPLTIMGPPFAGFLDNGSLAASFVGTSSTAFSSTITAAAWTFPDGQSEARLGHEGSVVGKTFTGASPAGKYFSLAVTDAKGNSQISRRLGYVFSDRDQPAEVEISQIKGTLRRGGYNGSVRVVSGGNTSQFPDRAEILIFEETSYAGTATQIGGNYPFRENIVFRGYISDDTTTINPFSGDVTFKIVSLTDILDKTYSKDIFHAHANPPTGTSEWIEAANLCLDYTALDLVKHRSTIAEITDFHVASGVGMEGKIAFQDLPKSSLWKQLKVNYNQRGVRGYVATDLQGNIYATEDVLISGASTSLPLVWAIQQSDRRDVIQIPHQHYDKNALVELYTVASVTPVGARSPGADAYGYWGGTTIHERGLVADENAAAAQQTLTTWSGNLRAKLNNPFPKITVPLAGNVKLDAVPQSRVQMSLSPTENVRGLDWSNKQFLSTGVTLKYNKEAGAVLTDLQLESIVDGKGGSAITFASIIPMKPTTTPTLPVPPFAGGSLVAFNDTQGTYRYSTEWEAMNTGLTGGDIQDFAGTKSGTNNVLYKGVAGKILKTEDKGVTWTNDTPGGDPDGSAASAVDYVWYEPDPTDNTKHYFLARNNVGGTWYSWLLHKDSSASTNTWMNLPLSTGAAIGTSVASYSPVYKSDQAPRFDDDPLFFNISEGEVQSAAYFDASNFAVLFWDSGSSYGTYMRNWNIVSDTSLNSQTVYNLHDDYSYFARTRHIPGTSNVVVIDGKKDFDDPGGSMQVWGRVVQNSGGSLVMGAAKQVSNHLFPTPTIQVLDGGVAVPNSSEAYFAWYDGAENLIRRGTISGTTLTLGATIYNFPGAGSDTPYTNYLRLDSLDGNKLVAYAGTHTTADASACAWIFDLQGASIVSYGPFKERLGGSPIVNPESTYHGLVALNRNIFVVIAGSKPGFGQTKIDYAMPASVSYAPTTSVNYGTMYKVWEDSAFRGTKKLDASNFIMYSTNAGGGHGLSTIIVNVNGLSLNAGSPTGTKPGDWDGGGGISAAVPRPGLIGFIWSDASGTDAVVDGLLARIDLGAEGGQTQAKGLGLAISGTGETAYTTYTNDTDLKLDVAAIPAMTNVTTVGLGTGTVNQSTSNVQVAFPTTIDTDDFCYIHGRMSDPAGLTGDPAHIIKTENRGTSFSLVESGWGSDHAGAMGRSGGTGFAVRNISGVLGAFYTVSSGVKLKSTLPFPVNPGGLLITNDGYVILGASTPETDAIRYSVSPWSRWYRLRGYAKSGGVTGLTLLT